MAEALGHLVEVRAATDDFRMRLSTSYFTEPAKAEQRKYQFRLTLREHHHLVAWLKGKPVSERAAHAGAP